MTELVLPTPHQTADLAMEDGAIIRVKEGSASQEVVSGLSFPTSIDFNAAGDAFVTINSIGAPGTGEVVKYAGLASGSSSGR